MNLIEIINKLEEENKQNKKTPSHVLFMPLSKECNKLGISRKELELELDKLLKDYKIKVGNTINDKYITANK